MSSEVYIEDNPITLPVLNNGVTRLGDLWDCNRSVFLGQNLFNVELDGENVIASPIDNVDYKLIHSKSTSEKIKYLKLGGEVSLDVLGGIISISGGEADYHYEKKTIENEKKN